MPSKHYIAILFLAFETDHQIEGNKGEYAIRLSVFVK